MAGARSDAQRFVREWSGRGDEKQDTELFWIDLMQSVLGLEDATRRLRFQVRADTDAGTGHFGFADVSVPSAKAIIEQKSLGVDLDRPEVRQGREVTPVQQALAYANGMPYSDKPRYIVTCNFETFRIYDTQLDPTCRKRPLELRLKDLPSNVSALRFLDGGHDAPESLSRAVSVEAGRVMGRIHDLVAAKFIDPDSEDSHHALSVFCTRVMFLMFCEDAGIIEAGLFRDYVNSFSAEHLRRALKDLFAWLDTPEGERDPYEGGLLAKFPYMNGGLFRERTEIPQLDETVKYAIATEGSQAFDWSGVDPTVFGSIFEGALSHDARRAGGMHYTSPENIHRVIDPLFLDGLRAELDEILAKQSPSARTRALKAYQERLGRLSFLDPACGSGNFLTEAYVCLRRLENRVLAELQKSRQQTFVFEEVDGSPVRVSLENFHGIEINDFACCVARTALWIAEKQADADTAKITRRVYDELPLRDYGCIVRGNALRMDWNDVVPAERCDYIMGNPPFIGHQWRSKAQQDDMGEVFGKLRGAGKLDYVCAWFEKAVRYMGNADVKAAFVATNSICQGESVGILWRRLAELGMSIDFAWKPFVWNSEADDEAHVHVVITGFSHAHSGAILYPGEGGDPEKVSHINGYLTAAPDVFIENRGKPVNDGAPEMTKGSQPTDGGNLILSDEERAKLLAKHPELDEVIRPYVGGREFLNGGTRWCLWFAEADISNYAFPEIAERLKAVAEARNASPTASVREAAATPHLFTQIRQPKTDYLALPEVSSGRRKYLSVGYMDKDEIASNKLRFIPTDSLYIFGLLSSFIHGAWMRVVAGRLKSDYSYSPAVYNSFVFPDATNEQRLAIELAGQGVIDARARYKGKTLAELYDPDKEVFYPELFSAHRALDDAVEAAYGVDFDGNEERIVAHLFNLYAEKVEGHESR